MTRSEVTATSGLGRRLVALLVLGVVVACGSEPDAAPSTTAAPTTTTSDVPCEPYLASTDGLLVDIRLAVGALLDPGSLGTFEEVAGMVLYRLDNLQTRLDMFAVPLGTEFAAYHASIRRILSLLAQTSGVSGLIFAKEDPAALIAATETMIREAGDLRPDC